MKKFIAIALTLALLLSFTACGKEVTIGEYDESQLTNGKWVQAQYLGCHEDTSTATISAEVKISWQSWFFYCNSEPTLEVGEVIEVYLTDKGEILAVR